MKNVLFAMLSLLFLAFYSSCDSISFSEEKIDFSRLEASKLIYDNPGNRIGIWEKIEIRNQFLIWKDKVAQVLTQDISNDWREMFQDLNENLTFERYETAALRGLDSEPYLSAWNDSFSKIATEEERYATIGCIFDYNSSTNTINLDRTKTINVNMVKIDNLPNIIRPRVGPGTGHSCDCRWGGCPIGEEYECKPSGTTDCSQTTTGCGFLLFQSCTHFCLNCYEWDCDNY